MVLQRPLQARLVAFIYQQVHFFKKTLSAQLMVDSKCCTIQYKTTQYKHYTWLKTIDKRCFLSRYLKLVKDEAILTEIGKLFHRLTNNSEVHAHYYFFVLFFGIDNYYYYYIM